MEQLVGRKEEIDLLNKLWTSGKAELLAIYGRRRIGKTFLISQFFKDKGLYFEMTGIRKGHTRQQISLFISRLRKVFSLPPGVKCANWFEAFDLLEKVIESSSTSKRITLFFDELPWMATHKSDLLQAFETSWNGFLSRCPNLVVVVCGSAVTWMIRKIVRNKGGLHGRLTAQIRLKPFTLSETRAYLEMRRINLSYLQIVEIYMAMGGVPKYLSYIEPGKSPAQIIQELCFSSTGPLVAEFDQLYESLFDNFQMHLRIIELLATKRKGLTYNELVTKSDLKSGGSLSRALKELIASGFVQFMPFFGRTKREGTYRLVDEYSLFYLSWIRDATHNFDEPISTSYWMKQGQSSRYATWAGYTFESICLKHIRQIIEALKLSVIADSATYWAQSSDKSIERDGGQIDLIIDRSDQCMNLCEIKFYSQPLSLTKGQAEKLNTRRELFRKSSKTRKTLINTLITASGVIVNEHYLSAVENHLDLEALFNY